MSSKVGAEPEPEPEPDPEPEPEPEGGNKPRNFLVVDATQPFNFTYIEYGRPNTIVVNQTNADITWPGGALWDIGVILAKFFVALAGFSTTTKEKSEIPSRLLHAIPSIKDLTCLELGCGVGLTGIVASTVLGTKLAILTDLDVVVEKVTQPNVEINSTLVVTKGNNNTLQFQKACRLTKAGKRGRIMAMPLCWGNEQDEITVMQCLDHWNKKSTNSSSSSKSQRRRKQKHNAHHENRSKLNAESPTLDDSGIGDDLGHEPDIIIIGDVAYQHRLGGPSHFDVLVSTLLKFLGQNTIVVFGTRMRMPASADLLDMFLEHMEEVTTPPIRADEIDPTFKKFKHQITIHILRKKRKNNIEWLHSKSTEIEADCAGYST